MKLLIELDNFQVVGRFLLYWNEYDHFISHANCDSSKSYGEEGRRRFLIYLLSESEYLSAE